MLWPIAKIRTVSIESSPHRKLQSSVEQYQVTIKKLQIVEQELNTMKLNFGAATKDKAVMESKIKELTSRVTEITNINNSVTMVKTKLENELKSVSADYDDIARELKLADERANKASGDAAHFESLMREEHARLVQLDQAKKALETEVGAVQFLGCVKCVQRERESKIRQMVLKYNSVRF